MLTHTDRSPRRGSTLVLAVVVLSALTVLTLTFMQFSTQADRETQHLLDDIETLYIAETGIAEAATALIEYADPNIGSFEQPVRFGDGLFWVEGEEVEPDKWLLTVTAMSGSARTSLEALVELRYEESDAPFVLLTNRRISANDGGAFFDSWDPALGSYESQVVNDHEGTPYAGVLGTIGSNEGIHLGSGAEVFGDVVLGPQGELKETSGQSYVSGDIYSTRTNVHMPPLEPPNVGPSQGRLEVWSDRDPGFDVELGPGEIHYEDLSVKRDARLKITGPATIVVDRQMDVDGEIFIDGTDGPVAIFVGKQLHMKNDSVINTLSGSAADFFLLIGDYDDSTQALKKRKAKIDGKFTGVLYAPYAHVSMHPKGEVFGTVMSYSVKHRGNRFHYDESLALLNNPFIRFDPRIFIITWRTVGVEPKELRVNRIDPFALLGLDRHEMPTPGEAWETGNDPRYNFGDIDWSEDAPWVLDGR